MSENALRLSPYCVFHPSPDGNGAILVHSLYGSRFELSPDLFKILLALLAGTPLEAIEAARDAEAKAAVASLAEERVLLTPAELAELAADDLFGNRLTPIELAVHRGLNEGGYFPELVDQRNPPGYAREGTDVPFVVLRTYDTFDGPQDLVDCLRERRSVRSYADDPLPLAALEQFLQLAARSFALVQTPNLGWVSYRNYPSGGARYPLEIYPVVYNVAGLTAGAYFYCPFRHRLETVPTEPEHRRALLNTAVARMSDVVPRHGRPAVLFVITAVFARTCWKYRGMPYHIILEETGALYQTMYLTATRLGLAPCAIGAFPERAVAEILGLDSRDEAQVGLFALGVPEIVGPEQAAFTITDVRLIEPSPFTSEGGGQAVEFTLGAGPREVIDLDRVCLETTAAGQMQCRVLRGRYLASFDEASSARMRQFLLGRNRPLATR
jgi:SagB-type dehydrogenase family enzyme